MQINQSQYTTRDRTREAPRKLSGCNWEGVEGLQIVVRSSLRRRQVPSGKGSLCKEGSCCCHSGVAEGYPQEARVRAQAEIDQVTADGMHL
jgi:hypothetical protein